MLAAMFGVRQSVISWNTSQDFGSSEPLQNPTRTSSHQNVVRKRDDSASVNNEMGKRILMTSVMISKKVNKMIMTKQIAYRKVQ